MLSHQLRQQAVQRFLDTTVPGLGDVDAQDLDVYISYSA